MAEAASPVREAKAAARTTIKAALRQLTKEEMATQSDAIAQHLLASKVFMSARELGLYVHCAKLREVDTSALIKQALAAAGQTCYVPVVEDQSSNMKLLHLDDMSALVTVPPFGIMEPSPAYADGQPRKDVVRSGVPLDLLLMPGLGFDRKGGRLGRGGGYYDKMIEQLQQLAAQQGRAPPLLVALSFSAQMVDLVPRDSHDQEVDVLVTPEGVMGCSERGKAAFV